MSLIKSEAKLSAVNELGSRLDDALENATKELQKEEGAVNALKNATTALENFMKVASEELDSKNVDLESQVYIKKFVERARNIVKTMASAAENSRQAQAGKISAFQYAVGIAKKYKDEEFKKLHMMRAAIERNLENPAADNSELTESQQPRAVGTRPSAPIKMRRLVAEEVQKSSSEDVKSQTSDNSQDSRSETKEESYGELTEAPDIKLSESSDRSTSVEIDTKSKSKKQKK